MTFEGCWLPPVVSGFRLVALATLRRLHQCTVLAVRDKDSVESGGVHFWLGYQRGQPGDEVQRFEDDMCGAITVRRLKLLTDIIIWHQRQALFRDRRADNVAAQAFQLVPFMRPVRHTGVQRKTRDIAGHHSHPCEMDLFIFLLFRLAGKYCHYFCDDH